MSDETVEMKTKGLDQIIKALKDRLPTARVGVLGAKTNRKTDGKAMATNAGIGAVHEFGSSKMPQRSFLRVPIAEHLQKKMESSGAFDEDVLKEVVASGTIIPWIKKIAVLGEAIVAEGFATGGFGKWPAWKTPGYKNDDNRLLVDTRQLRDSISSDVK